MLTRLRFCRNNNVDFVSASSKCFECVFALYGETAQTRLGFGCSYSCYKDQRWLRVNIFQMLLCFEC